MTVLKKPSEFISYRGLYHNKLSLSCHSSFIGPLRLNYDKECINGYYICELGNIIVIKSTIKYFAYATMRYSSSYLTQGIPLNEAISIIDKSGTVIDKVLWVKMNMQLAACEI
jgi:hypothetical protein